jgi:hypothetical protein
MIDTAVLTHERAGNQEDLIAVIFDAAPEEYQYVLTNEQLRLGNSVTLNALETAMNAPRGEPMPSKKKEDTVERRGR